MDLLQTTLCYLEKDGAYLMLHRVKKKNDVNHDTVSYTHLTLPTNSLV